MNDLAVVEKSKDLTRTRNVNIINFWYKVSFDVNAFIQIYKI